MEANEKPQPLLFSLSRIREVSQLEELIHLFEHPQWAFETSLSHLRFLEVQKLQLYFLLYLQQRSFPRGAVSLYGMPDVPEQNGLIHDINSPQR